MKPKTKKGQILIYALLVMAVGTIVLTPLLYYLGSSYSLYSNKLTDTNAYYAADAMMEVIINDMRAEPYINISTLNASGNYDKHPANGWLSGYNVYTSINTSVAFPSKTAADSDFTITTTAWHYTKSRTDPAASVTACIRRSTGPTITIFSWNATYY